MTEQTNNGAYPPAQPTTGQPFAPGEGPAKATPGTTGITVSRGLGAWMRSHNASLAFTSYQIVNLASGDIVEWIRLEGHITELFDVTVLPGVRCPMSLGPGTVEIQNTISFEPLAVAAAAQAAA